MTSNNRSFRQGRPKRQLLFGGRAEAAKIREKLQLKGTFLNEYLSKKNKRFFFQKEWHSLSLEPVLQF